MDLGEFKEESHYTIDEMRRMIDASQMPDELKKPLAIELARRAPLKSFVKPGSRFQKGIFGGKYWAIRKDSFKLIEIVAGTALAITTFAAVVGASPAVFAVTLIIGVVTLGERLRHKGADLESYQYQILVILKAIGPTTAKEVAKQLSGLHIHGQNIWTEQEAFEALMILKAVHLRDGSVEALVTQAANGLWAANGI